MTGGRASRRPSFSTAVAWTVAALSLAALAAVWLNYEQTTLTSLSPDLLRRTLEIWTAAAAGLVAVIVIAESLTHDIGWNEAGPGSGYFPFRLGLLLFAAASVRAWQTVRGAGPASSDSHASGPAEIRQRRTAVIFRFGDAPTLIFVISLRPGTSSTTTEFVFSVEM